MGFLGEAHKGAPAVKAHMDFVRQTDTDILKIMNENVFYDGMTRIYSTADDVHLIAEDVVLAGITAELGDIRSAVRLRAITRSFPPFTV